MGVYHYPVVKDWIENKPGVTDFPHDPYRNGIGAYEGVVLHYTANEQDTAQGEDSYETNTWSGAFVHEFIDWNQIIQVADPQYQCWGCGPNGNPRFIQIEMCHADTQDEFDAIFDMTCERVAEYLAARRLGVTQAKSDCSGTLWTHADVTMYLGGTDHTDPLEYIQRWGKKLQDVIERVTTYYNGLIAESQPVTPPAQPPPVPKTPIFGQAKASVNQMRAYLKQKNPNAPDYAQIYLDIGAKYGIAGDLAFCQSIKETNAFTFKKPDGTSSDVKPEQNNFAGIGAVGGGASGATFATPQQGIEAQIEHLYGYATTNSLPPGVTCVDPRFSILQTVGKRGTAPNWEDLDGRWANPGVGYGESVVSMWKDLCAVVVAPPPSETDLAIKWVQDNGILIGDETGFNPDANITRGQLAVAIYRMANKFKMGV